MARQHVDYTTSALSPPNAPANDGLDTGSADAAAIRPVIDGQAANAANLSRPSENLRTRTETIRSELEDLKYLSDADRAILLGSAGTVSWYGPAPGAPPAGEFTISSEIVIRPFKSVRPSSASRLIICAGTVAQVTFRTVKQLGLAPRAYSGANDITIDFQPVDTGTGTVVVTATGSPANNVHVQYDSNAVSGTTVNQNGANGLVTQFNLSAVAIALGIEAVIEGGGVPVEVGFPTPPGPVVASKIESFIIPSEKLTRYMSGAVDDEQHTIAPASFVTFFSDPLNLLLENDTVCVQYDELVADLPSYGGRRQAIDEAPEFKSAIPAGNLFLLRRFPERLPLAIPICTVFDGKLVFTNGRVYDPNETGPLLSSGAAYQGSPGNPNSWADNTGVAQGGPPITFEVALDTIIQTLGKKTAADPGAIKIGFTPTGNFIGPASSNVKLALEQLDTEKAGLALANTFTAANIFNGSAANTAVTATAGAGTGSGVRGNGGSNAITTGPVHGTNPTPGPGGGGAFVGGTGVGGGDGVQGFGRSSDTARSGVYGVGAWTTAANAHAGPGGAFYGGTPGSGNANGGTGVIARGAGKLGGGVDGAGVDALGAGAAAGVFAVGGSSGVGVRGEGGGGAASGVEGYGGPTNGAGVQGFGTADGPGGKFVTDAAAGPGSSALVAECLNTDGGFGITSTGTGAYAGGTFISGATGSANGVVGTTFASNGAGVSGVVDAGVTDGYGVRGAGRGDKSGGLFEASGNVSTSGRTNGVSPAAGPGTGAVGIGSADSGGGDGGQFFGRAGVGSTAIRAGVSATGAYSQTTAIQSGPGGSFLGGTATVGNAAGGHGITATGGGGIGGGSGGTGGVFVSGGTDGKAIFASGTSTEAIVRIDQSGAGYALEIVGSGIGTGATAIINSNNGYSAIQAGNNDGIEAAISVGNSGGGPGLRVTDGDVEVSSTNNFAYTTAKTFTHHVPLPLFTSETSAGPADTALLRPHANGYRWVNRDATAAVIYGAVTGIPAGAILTGASAWFSNASAVGPLNFLFDLQRHTYDGGGQYTKEGMLVGGVEDVNSIAIATSGWYSAALHATSSRLVFPANGYVAVLVQLPAAAVATETLSFGGLFITYTMTDVVPVS